MTIAEHFKGRTLKQVYWREFIFKRFILCSKNETAYILIDSAISKQLTFIEKLLLGAQQFKKMETFCNEGLFGKDVLKDRRGKQKIKRNNGINDKNKKNQQTPSFQLGIATQFYYFVL